MGAMGAWVCGCMGVWVRGCVGAWVHGCASGCRRRVRDEGGGWRGGRDGGWHYGREGRDMMAEEGAKKKGGGKEREVTGRGEGKIRENGL